MNILRILSVLVFVFWSTAPPVTHALTSKFEKWVKVLESPKLEYESPDRFTPFSLEDAPEDINYRTSILPYIEDRNEDMYMVMPTLGLITPVVFVPEDSVDFNNMVSGREIDINKYLPEWVMHYPNTWMPWDVANPVIFWHSNYFKNKEGKYKSIFADIMNLDVNPSDEIWTYHKLENGTYDLRKFEIEQSYETVPTDVGVITPRWWKELTVFACTDWLNWRWILKWRLIENDEILITYPMKFDMYDIVEWLSNKSDARKKEIILVAMKRLEEIRENASITWTQSYSVKYKIYVLNYIEKELAKIF